MMAPGASFFPSKVPAELCLPRRRQGSKLGRANQRLSITRNKHRASKESAKRQQRARKTHGKDVAGKSTGRGNEMPR